MINKKTVLDSNETLSSEIAVSTVSETIIEDKKSEVIRKVMMRNNNYVSLKECFMIQEPILHTLKFNISCAINTLLLGPTGVGKTELVDNIASDLGLPLTIFDMGTMTDPVISLVGTHRVTVQDGKTVSTFEKSRFSKAIQKPGIILLDEISRASVAANNLLFPCLDFRRQLAMEYCFEDQSPIKIHPECVFIATANLGSQYTGTHKLDMALKDRFTILEIDSLPKNQVKDIIKYNYPSLKWQEVDMIIDAYFAVNNAEKDFLISFCLSLRHIKNMCNMIVNGFTIYDSFYMIIKGLGGTDAVKALEEILNGINKSK